VKKTNEVLNKNNESSFLEKNLNKGLVSIIMPSFNSGSFIEATVNTVLKQTFINWELIIIDDCSTDNSLKVIEKMVESDKRIKLIPLKVTGGTAKARNEGLKEASGQYIVFLDSDDLWDENFLESQIDFMHDNGPIITAGYRIKSQKNMIVFSVPKIRTYKQLLKQNTMSCLTTMYDRNIIGDVYFEEDLVKAEDFAFWLNILRRGYVTKGNQEILATYIIHENSKSFKKSKLIKPMFHIYRRNQGYNWFKSLWYVLVWGINGLKKYRKIR